MKNLFAKRMILLSFLVGIVSTSNAATVDGYFGPGEYSESFIAGWYNGHNQAGSQFQKDDDHETTVYWESTGDNFFLYLQVPLAVKNMIWGTGFTDDEALLYYQHWCSPTDGNPAADDGSNCGHHKDGFDKFRSDKTDYSAMTGSEKAVFGQGPIKTGKDGFEIFDTKSSTVILADLAGDVTGDLYGDMLEYKDSVDYVINNRGCNTINCDASDIPMAFEFMFASNESQRKSLIKAIEDNGIEFHLSPERGVTSVVPIPASVWLFGSGLLGLVGVARRQSKSKGERRKEKGERRNENENY